GIPRARSSEVRRRIQCGPGEPPAPLRQPATAAPPAQSRRACTWPFSSASAHLAPPAWLTFDTNELRRGSPPFHVAQDGRELVERPKRRWRAGGRIRISHADHGETVIWIAPLSPPRGTTTSRS